MDKELSDIVEGNKLIAEFEKLQQTINNIDTPLLYSYKGNWFAEDELNYHTSWDWLMPVWYKFRDTDFKHSIMANYIAQIAFHLAYGEITDVHRVLCNGIKWYNQSK